MVEQANRPVHPSKGNPSTLLSPSKDQIIDDAKQWARKALDVAADIHPPVRDEACDVSCVVATVNLGYLSEMQNRLKEADDLFESKETCSRYRLSGRNCTGRKRLSGD